MNNAGVNTLAHRVTIDEFPRQEWDRILAVDLTGLYEVSRAAARVMRAQGSGRIINIASIAGLVPLRLQCAFVAAKAGVVNLTKAHGPGARPARHPGQRHRARLDPDRGHPAVVLRRGRPVPRLGQADARPRPAGPARHPDEIAVAALFLADPENSYMNGHMLPPSTAAGRPAMRAISDLIISHKSTQHVPTWRWEVSWRPKTNSSGH